MASKQGGHLMPPPMDDCCSESPFYIGLRGTISQISSCKARDLIPALLHLLKRILSQAPSITRFLGVHRLYYTPLENCLLQTIFQQLLANYFLPKYLQLFSGKIFSFAWLAKLWQLLKLSVMMMMVIDLYKLLTLNSCLTTCFLIGWCNTYKILHQLFQIVENG